MQLACTIKAAAQSRHGRLILKNEPLFPNKEVPAASLLFCFPAVRTLSASCHASRFSFRLLSSLLSWERPWPFSSAWLSSPPIFFRPSPEPSWPPVYALQERIAGSPQRLGARK